MKKMNNRKGFTLAELLIVVAIIAVLVAIAIPVFTKQLEKAREATDLANIRSAYSEVMVQFLNDDNSHSMDVTKTQTITGWELSDATLAGTAIGTIDAGGSGTVTVKISAADGTVTIGNATISAK